MCTMGGNVSGVSGRSKSRVIVPHEMMKVRGVGRPMRLILKPMHVQLQFDELHEFYRSVWCLSEG